MSFCNKGSRPLVRFPHIPKDSKSVRIKLWFTGSTALYSETCLSVSDFPGILPRSSRGWWDKVSLSRSRSEWGRTRIAQVGVGEYGLESNSTTLRRKLVRLTYFRISIEELGSSSGIATTAAAIQFFSSSPCFALGWNGLLMGTGMMPADGLVMTGWLQFDPSGFFCLRPPICPRTSSATIKRFPMTRNELYRTKAAGWSLSTLWTLPKYLANMPALL